MRRRCDTRIHSNSSDREHGSGIGVHMRDRAKKDAVNQQRSPLSVDGLVLSRDTSSIEVISSGGTGSWTRGHYLLAMYDARSSIRLAYAYSLSYQTKTLAALPMSTLVEGPSIIPE